MLREDTEPDQDRPRGSSVTGDLPINYGNVVEMLRKSPSAAAAKTETTSALPVHARATVADSQASPSGSGMETSFTLPSTEISAQPFLFGGASSSTVAAAGPGRSTVWAVEPAGTTGPGSGPQARHPTQGPNVAEAKAGPKGRAGVATTGTAAVEANGGGAPLHRGDVSITPASLRPRFNPADATTIIAFGEESEDRDDNGGPSSRDSPGDGAGAAAEGRAGETDPVTAAFEAALLGRGGPVTGGGSGLGGGPSLAWATSRSTASPIDTAAADVERRLRALEAALGPRGGHGGAVGSLPVHEEVAEMRREMRQIQSDNAKLRQELGAFSSHASMLLTQLQAQVQHLLRTSGSGGAGAASVAAPPAPAPAPFSSSRQHQTAPHRQAQQPLGPAPGTTTSIPTTTAAAATAAAAHSVYGSHTSYGDLYGAQHASSSYQPQQSHRHQPAPLEQQQPLARRNIFADLDTSSLRPLGTTTRSGGGGEGNAVGMTAATPYSAFRPAGAHEPAAAPSPLIDVAAVPSAPYSVPVRDMDDAEVVLPSFAAFRRSAGATTFTSARPAASSATPGSLTSPNLAAAAAAPAPPGPDPSRVSPSSIAAIQARPFPTQYQPRSIGGVIVRPNSSKPPATTGVGAVAAAAAGGANTASGAYVTALAASAAAAATGSNAAAVELARSHSGLPQPMVFSVGPEFRSVRATGLSAENSMSLSAHSAAAAAARSKASVPSRSAHRPE
ncbi:hypothetical protein PLESTB_001862700 [Pleodorina starrii]|uniref:Uncharacterized protein n=1 Tax=Pleodorina starrii TaxID=330485 RepID=A0A9W6C1X5_9CHLO|nr:hypothetical protein PLESTB_001862700 [Pleodorina starrii]